MGLSRGTFTEDDPKMKSVPNIFTQNSMKEESFSESNISDKIKLQELSKLTIFYTKRLAALEKIN